MKKLMGFVFKLVRRVITIGVVAPSSRSASTSNAENKHLRCGPPFLTKHYDKQARQADLR